MLNMQIGEITTPTTGHKNFATQLFAALQNSYPLASQACFPGTHQSGRTATDNDGIVVIAHENIKKQSIKSA